ncbi:MAG TPA: hypothetical protein EYM39_02605 [Candidatus Latescibacteria bacterium]|nr:hypothetical protein [Candidatus Latescibacterota bacterium]
MNLVEPIGQLTRSVIAPQLINHRVPPAILALKIGENIPDPHGPVARTWLVANPRPLDPPVRMPRFPSSENIFSKVVAVWACIEIPIFGDEARGSGSFSRLVQVD